MYEQSKPKTPSWLHHWMYMAVNFTVPFITPVAIKIYYVGTRSFIHYSGFLFKRDAADA